MAYIINGERYTDQEARRYILEDFTPYLAIEFYDLNYGPVDVGYSTFDVNDTIRGLIAIGRIDEQKMFEDFVSELFRIVRNGNLNAYELPYDIEGMDIRYLPTKTASVGSGKKGTKGSGSKSASIKGKSKAPTKKPAKAGRR